MISSIEIKVRGYHIDYYGHVNNARYLEFLEEGRWVFFEQNASFRGWRSKGFIFLVVNININYRNPASLSNLLEIRTNISRLGDESGIMHQEIVIKGTDTIIIDADVTFVIANANTKKAQPIEGELRAAFEKAMDSTRTAVDKNYEHT
jgi:thioesterase III